jgi:hypothetical protein
VEDGSVVRLDSTVTAALMHEPSDSSLLWDAVRVMVRLLKEADSLLGGAAIAWRDRRRAAKKRARAIQFIRGQPKRLQLSRKPPRVGSLSKSGLGLLFCGTLRCFIGSLHEASGSFQSGGMQQVAEDG